MGQDILDRDILPRVFSSLDTVFPEFGWRRAKDGWVATNGNFTRSRFEARPDRVVCRQERGLMIYGDKSYHWLEYLYGADFPRGADWWTVVEELAGGAPPFFGADVAFAAYRKSRPDHGVIVVEGMFDALTLRAHGLPETLAIGRAGLSEEAFLALEIAGEATLLLDGDDAGQKGTMQAIQTWAETMSPVRLSVTRLFAHKDPDELVRARGIDALRDVLAHRMPAASAYVASLLSGAESEAELLSAAHKAVPFLASVAVCHPLEAAMATELLSRRGLSSSALKLLTRQLDEEGLMQVRDSLQRRLSEVEGLLGEG